MLKKFKLMLILLIATSMTGCAKLWPYKSDFDCPVPQGERCKSLYEVNKMADKGKFDPNTAVQPVANKNKNSCNSLFCCKKNN